MSVSRDSKQNILQTSFDKVRWWSRAGAMLVRFCTPGLPKKGRLHPLGPKLSASQPRSENINMQLEVKGLHPGGAARSWLWDLLVPLCSLVLGVIQATRSPTTRLYPLQARQATRQTQNFTMFFFQPPKRLLYTSPTERKSSEVPHRPVSHPGHGTDILPQPAPALSALLCTYTCQVVQPDIYKALSNA